jgi:uncharacterized protein
VKWPSRPSRSPTKVSRWRRRTIIPTYQTPGVYRVAQAAAPEAFALVRTDIAAFLGYAERGPLPPAGAAEFDAGSVVRRLTTWRDFQVTFGGFIASGYLAYAVRAFFENGGRTCYVARIAAIDAARPDDRPATAWTPLPIGAPVLTGTLAPSADPWLLSYTSAGAVTLRSGDAVVIEHEGLRIDTAVDFLRDGAVRFTRPLPDGLLHGASLSKRRRWAWLEARSAGRWGNRIRVQVLPLDPGFIALRISHDRGLFETPETEFYPRLSRQPDAENFAPAVLARESALVSMRIDEPQQAAGEDVPPAADIKLSGGRDGLAAITPADFIGRDDLRRGLNLLRDVGEVAIVCAADAVFPGAPKWRPRRIEAPPCAPPIDTPPDPASVDPTAAAPAFGDTETAEIYQAMIDHCERMRYRVAVLDAPDRLQPAAASEWADANRLRNQSSHYAALYYPWMEVPDPLALSGSRRSVPACGHVAGAYASNDLNEGVHHPPANIVLEGATDVARDIDDEGQGALNERDLNVIRSRPGRGIRIWGARSLAAASHSAWRYIHVRRLMSAVEHTVEKSTMWAVFQSNDANLRRTLVHSLEVLLEGIWLKGGLKGALPEQGFYVKCDDTNNPPSAVNAGRLVCEVGIAVAAPMEFIVFEMRLSRAGSEVVEA